MVANATLKDKALGGLCLALITALVCSTCDSPQTTWLLQHIWGHKLIFRAQTTRLSYVKKRGGSDFK